MDYLQYKGWGLDAYTISGVLNLIINGLPSILQDSITLGRELKVLNLIINGLPSICSGLASDVVEKLQVLNLIINGLPSIL